MPFRAPSICSCGRVVASGQRCACKAVADRQRERAHDAKRGSARERGYNSKWQRERTAYLIANALCTFCPAPATVVDHITPHKGDMRLFWSRSNWQPLCKKCHDRDKQKIERAR